MRLPESGAVTGWAACRLYGANFLDGVAADGRTQFPVPLLVDPSCKLRSLPGSALVYGDVGAARVHERYGIATVSLEWAVYDAIRLAADDREAVVVMEAVAAARLTSVRRVLAHAQQRAGGRRAPRGHRQVLAALARSGERSRSPNETRLRLICERDVGLSSLWVNVPVYDGGRLIGVADLLQPHLGLVIEFDGADHRRATRHQRDVAKDAGLRDAGLEVVRVTGLDLLPGSRGALIARLQSGMGRAAGLPRGRWAASCPVDSLDDELDAAHWRELDSVVHG